LKIVSSISRFAEYYRRHGLSTTLHRGWVAARRALFARRMVVFYCDLNGLQLSQEGILKAAKLERVRTQAELSAEHFQRMTSFWNPKQATQNIRERFEKGASLWLLEYEGELAGYGWTLQGSTIEPYYFPLAKDDVHFFDFHVYPAYRGRGMNPYLVDRILDNLVSNGAGRAFIEAAEWNEAQLSSLGKTRFRPLGAVRTLVLLGRRYVSWTRNDFLSRTHEVVEPADRDLRAARSNQH
jgi:GNAT superfamily N-acetyltransferase